MPTVAELQAEIRRLHTALAVEQSRNGSAAQNGPGVGGRQAIQILRDDDYPLLQRAVDNIPAIRQNRGRIAAEAYIRTVVRSALDALIFEEARTGDLVQTRHRLHMQLSIPGEGEVLMRSDGAGARARVRFLEACERYAYALSVRSAFSRGSETPPGLVPGYAVPGRT